MANKTLFASQQVVRTRCNAVNEAGGRAYEFSPKHALAQMAATGTLADNYYTSASNQLDTVLEIAKKIKEDQFIAKTALYSRLKGYMKDMPALLCVMLSKRNPELLKKIFPHVIDNGRMIRNFVQIIRSGAADRKSLGSVPKNLIQKWFKECTPLQLLNASVGNDPSLADVIKLARPKPANKEREALYGWFLGRDVNKTKLPKVVQQFEKYKAGKSKEMPDVSFQLLTGLPLDTAAWTTICKNAKWNMTKKNLNTFLRQGVFEDAKMVKMVADRLRDAKMIKDARIFPHEILIAYEYMQGQRPDEDDFGVGDKPSKPMPKAILEAIQDALDVLAEDIPFLDKKVWAFPDVSGSMSSPVTGDRGSASSKVLCYHAAGLISAILAKRSQDGNIIPFREEAVNFKFNSRDSIVSIASSISHLQNGGTNCSAPLRLLNDRKETGDLIVYLSDLESWVDCAEQRGGATATMAEWKKFKARNPKAKMVCIDLQANTTSQARDSADILNIGGFSTNIFETISNFLSGKKILVEGKKEAATWVAEIEAIDLNKPFDKEDED